MRWSRACLVACTVVAPAWGQGDAATATPPAAGLPRDESTAQGPGLQWRPPPVQWSGSVSYDLRLDHTHGQPRSTEHLVGTTLDALSYIYEPWLALVSGTLRVTASRLQGDATAPDGSDSFVTGGVRLNIFPRSRFPFDARYEVSDSRTDTSLGGNVDYRSRHLVLTQRYRPADNGFALSASYERRSQEGPTFGEDTQESLLADFSSRIKRHSLGASLARSLNRRLATGEETDFRSAVARHSYAVGSEFVLETSANWARSDDQLLIGGNQQTLSQWSSVALYRPEGLDLTLSASVRGFSFDNAATGGTESVAAGVGAACDVNRNFRLTGNGSATRTDGAVAYAWVGSLGGTYNGDTQRLGEFTYDWNAGASLSNARSGDLEDNTFSTQLGHTFGRQWLLAPGESWSATFGQTLGVSYTRGDTEAPGHPLGWSRALTQTAGLTFSSNGPDRNAFARLSFTDARQFDAERARFQLVNLQLSGNYQVDRWHGWSGDLTVQRVLQRAITAEPVPVLGFRRERLITHSASGEVTWRAQRVFGVPRLRFQSRVRLSTDTQTSDIVLLALPDRESAVWENRLDYLVGRLELSATLRLSKTDELWRELLLLRLQRNF